jgi:hypothetical protein
MLVRIVIILTLILKYCSSQIGKVIFSCNLFYLGGFMKYLVPVMLIAILVSGCNSRIDGQLNVTKDIKLRVFSGDKHLLRVGTYTADLSPNGSSKIALRINNDNDERSNFAIPEGSKIPDNGTVSFTAAQVGQAADVVVTVATTANIGPTQEGYISCTYQMPTQVCYPIPGGGMNCSIQYQTVFGQQWQRFYDRTIDKNLSLKISEPASTEVSAEFIGNSSVSERVVISDSPCR